MLETTPVAKMKNILKNKIMVAAILVTILVVGGLFAAYKNRSDDTDGNSVSSAEAETNDTESGEEATETEDTTEVDEQEANQPLPTKEDPPENQTAADSEVQILSAEIGEDNSVVVKTRVDNISSGTCELTITKGSDVITKTADLIYAAEFSSCAGFSVSRSEFTENGPWQVKLSVQSGDKTYASSSAEVSIP